MLDLEDGVFKVAIMYKLKDPKNHVLIMKGKHEDTDSSNDLNKKIDITKKEPNGNSRVGKYNN